MKFISLNDEVLERIDSLKRIEIKDNIVTVETYEKKYDFKLKDAETAKKLFSTIKLNLTK